MPDKTWPPRTQASANLRPADDFSFWKDRARFHQSQARGSAGTSGMCLKNKKIAPWDDCPRRNYLFQNYAVGLQIRDALDYGGHGCTAQFIWFAGYWPEVTIAIVPSVSETRIRFCSRTAPFAVPNVRMVERYAGELGLLMSTIPIPPAPLAR